MAKANNGGESNKVYTFIGHSGHIESYIDVPDKCMLITLGQCGEVTMFGSKSSIIRRFTTLFENPDKKHLLSDPLTNKAEIESLIGSEININHPNAPSAKNRKYYDVFYEGQLVSHNNVHRSGLYEPGAGVSFFETKLIDEKQLDSEDTYKFMYPREVIYPDYDAVTAQVKIIKEGGVASGSAIITKIGKVFSKKQSELFTTHPGIYYLISCRVNSTTNPNFKHTLNFRKQTSRANTNKSSDLYNYNIYPKNLKLHVGEVGHKYTLPLGVKFNDYTYKGKFPKFLGTNAKGRQVIELTNAPALGPALDPALGPALGPALDAFGNSFGPAPPFGGAFGGAGGPSAPPFERESDTNLDELLLAKIKPIIDTVVKTSIDYSNLVPLTASILTEVGFFKSKIDNVSLMMVDILKCLSNNIRTVPNAEKIEVVTKFVTLSLSKALGNTNKLLIKYSMFDYDFTQISRAVALKGKPKLPMLRRQGGSRNRKSNSRSRRRSRRRR